MTNKNNNNLPECYSKNSIKLLESRFLKTNNKGKPIETPQDMFTRIAKWVATADKHYSKDKKQIAQTEKDFYNVLFNLRFIPQSPTILNAGKDNKTLSACFVLPIKDSLDSIYKTLSDAVQVQWKGGGTGFNFSKIRPKGDKAGGIPDVAAGPVHFIKTFSDALMGVRQGGKRGGANIAILNVDHPDILNFIHMKEQDKTIMNFNISVGVTDKFMNALKNDEEYTLINPRNNRVVKKLRASYIFNEIVELAHRTGDPGIVFIDNIDNDNPTPKVGKIDATNPCGEQPLLPYESCNLGALNLRVHFDFLKKDLNWKKLRETINTAVHFLDNIIDINYYPLKSIEKITRHTNRKMGLGLMGFADILILKEIPYNSKAAIKYAEKVMGFIQKEAVNASIKIAHERGTFPAYKGSMWEKRKLPVRNATITTIAPNGNTSIIGGSTGGIEPVYALVYKIAGVEDKNYKATTVLFNVNNSFEFIAKKYKIYSKDLIKKLADNTHISEIAEIPDKIKSVLVTALDIEPIWHLKMQAAFQKHIDNAISKTINFSNEASIDDVRNVFIEAYKNNLKGVTIFRDGCKYGQTYVSSKKGKLNINKLNSNQIEIVIASQDKHKKQEIAKFIKQYNSGSKVVETRFKLPLKDTVHNEVSEQKLLDSAIRKAQSTAEQTGKIAIADETGFLSKKNVISKVLKEILYFGKDGDYSRKLYNNLIKLSLQKGTKAYISTALAIYDPFNKRLITTTTKIPGKLIKVPQEKHSYIFFHKGLDSFSCQPSELEFRSFHHRYQALQKVFENFSSYRKDSIEINLTKNAKQVLEKRVLEKDKNGNVIETPRQLFNRIAEYISQAGKNYDYTQEEIMESKKKFFKILKNLVFQCGGALIWAGMSDDKGKNAIWSKCFVLPIEDSIKDIFDTLNDNIEILRHGGGTGFNFSKIRSSFSKVSTTDEHAAGPIEYLKVFNRAQDTIIGRGGRQMGSMAVLNADHPNIYEFLKSKENGNELTHYNISIGISDKFMQAVKEDQKWKLRDPHDRKVYKTVHAKRLFNKICKYAWKSGDPGILFLDNMEKANPTKHLGKVDATNPCGEQPLLPYESCNLGNINLSKMVKDFPYLKDSSIKDKSLAFKLNLIDWDKFENTIQIAIEFLDNIIDINNYPIKKIENMTKKTRSIGLGLMGFADLLIKLGIPYTSKDAITISCKIMKFLSNKSLEASQKLSKKRGDFPEFKGSKWHKKGIKHMRNSRCTTIAPTGTVSIIANCNPGIEPIFALVFKRMNSLGGEEQIVVEELFEKVAKYRGFYSKELMNQLAAGKKLSDLDNIPKDVVEIFKTSHEINPEQHVRIQASFQKYCDSGVSKTINLPQSATVNDIEKIFQTAYDLRCKGITIFRDGCKSEAQKTGLEDTKEKKSTVSSDPRQRPTTTRGITTQVKTNQGTLYVTINEDEKGIAEIFLNIGKSGGYSSGYCEAIGRLISVSLRAGLSLDAIIDQLKGIRTSTPTLNKGMFVYSVPDAVGKVLENYQQEQKKSISMFKKTEKLEVKSEIDIKKEEKIVETEKIINISKKESNDTSSKYNHENSYDQLPECPDCGGDLQYAEGCIMCLSCGYSKCG